MKYYYFGVVFYLWLVFRGGEARADLSEFERGSLVPTSLVALIEEEYIKQVRLAHPTDARSDLQIKMNIPREFFEARIRLEPRGGKSLEEPLVLEVSRGGGIFDLADYLLTGGGLFSFKVVFATEWEDADLAGLKVFFVPRYKQVVKGEGEAKGLGCESYAEITHFFKKHILREGLLQTTAGQAYFSMMAGTYVLVATNAEGLKLATFTLLDKRFQDLRCPDQKRGPVKDTH